MYNMVNTDVICPNCGEGHMIREEPKVIKSNTETYAYLCPICGFVHTAKSDEDMKKWIKSLDKPIKMEIDPIIETEIKCPICGAFIFCDESVAYTSNPPQHKYYCPDCGEFSKITFSEESLRNYIEETFEVKKEKNYHAKQDYGKAKLSLVPRRIIWDVAAIREYGNSKYPDGGPDNWRGVEPERYRDAAYRHFLRYLDDPKSVDSESGLPHLWHLACNIAFLCEMEDMYLSKNPEVVERLMREFCTPPVTLEESEDERSRMRTFSEGGIGYTSQTERSSE